MSRPAIEFSIFSVNDAFTSQPSLFQNLLTGAREGGVKAQYYGLSTKKPRQLTWIMCYDKLSDQKNFKWPSEKWGDFFTKLMEVCDGNPGLPWIMEVDDVPNAAMAAPVTEIFHCALKPSASPGDVRAVINKMYAFAESVKFRGGAWGFHSENNRKVTGIVGWGSVEEHDVSAQSDGFIPIMQKLGELTSDFEVDQLELKRFD